MSSPDVRGWAIALLAAGCGPASALAPTKDGDHDAVAATDTTVIDAWPASGPFGFPFPAAASCTPTGSVCSSGLVDGMFASYRKDAFLPASEYPEANLPDPTAGGRVHVVMRSAVTGSVTSIRIRGQDAATLVTNGYLDWFHVWPEQLVAGAPIWVSFHSSATELDKLPAIELEVRTVAGTAAAGMVSLSRATVPITYVTTTESLDAYIVHVKNADTVSHTLSQLVVDGRDVTAAACIPAHTLAPGEAAMWRVPRCTPGSIGDAWTVVARWADAPPSAAGGRILAPRFPIHAWPVERDCPFPGGKPQALTAHQLHGFDTFFLRSNYTENGCAVTGSQIVAAAPSAGLFLMPDETMALPAGTGAAQHVAARLLADEADSTSDRAIVGTLAATSQGSWRSNPTLATYVGASRGRRVGRYAGAADLQGMDFYVAACAPHVTDALSHPPLRGAFDYLRLTRDNQMPLPTWLYTQGLHTGWNAHLFGAEIVRQPDPAESRIQAFSAIAAGGKGLMYFQTDLSLAFGAAAATWAAIGNQNRDLRSVRRFLREGDVTRNAGSSDPAIIVEAIRAPGAVVVIVIDTKTAGGIDDPACAVPTNTPHWRIQATAPDVWFDVPQDLAVGDAFEVRDGTIRDLPAGAYYTGRRVTVPAIALDTSMPTRMFVFATAATTRAEIAATF